MINFRWAKPVEVDAVALFPLRLYIDEIYGENLYWPGSVTIKASIGDEMKIIAQSDNRHPRVLQSLPDLIHFDPVVTDHLNLHCTDLPEHIHQQWVACGFAEVMIFSGADNVAPRATCRVQGSREGYNVLAQKYLIDSQTPLGLPEMGSLPETHPFVKKMGSTRAKPPTPYAVTMLYPEPTLIDAVRIDPAVQHSYGQGFPQRFTIDLLDMEGNEIRSDKTFENFDLRNPGLNPHVAYFPETEVGAVRLTILKADQSDPLATQTIAFSEISPLHKGVIQRRLSAIEDRYRGKTKRYNLGDPLDTSLKIQLAAACDGLTHSGSVLPFRQWTEGLVRRQELLEEQSLLMEAQQQTLAKVRHFLIYGSLILLILGAGSSLFYVVRNRIRARRELRLARAKIASDLHDDVGSNLGTIVLHLERLREQIKTPQELFRLESIYRLTRESVFGLREVLHTSAPEVGRTQDIIAYMREFAGLILGRTTYTFEADPSLKEELAEHPLLRKGLLLFYKEALHNAKKHSNCTHIDISLRSERRALVFRIKDNGSGIDEATLSKPSTLRTLKQRAEWFRGDLLIQSQPGEGTELTLTIDMKAQGLNESVRKG